MKRLIILFVMLFVAFGATSAMPINVDKKGKKEIERKKKEYNKRIKKAQESSKDYFVRARACANLQFAKTYNRKLNRKGLRK